MKISQIAFAAAVATTTLPAYAAVPGTPEAATEVATAWMVMMGHVEPANLSATFEPGPDDHTATVELVNSQPAANMPSCRMSMLRKPDSATGLGWEITNPNCVVRQVPKG